MGGQGGWPWFDILLIKRLVYGREYRTPGWTKSEDVEKEHPIHLKSSVHPPPNQVIVLGIVIRHLVGSDMGPSPLQSLLLAIGLYCFVGVLMDGPGSVACGLLGFKILPTFDQPWMSSSLADFWGRRWNITTSHLLRALIYDPIVEGTEYPEINKQVIDTKSETHPSPLCFARVLGEITQNLGRAAERKGPKPGPSDSQDIFR